MTSLRRTSSEVNCILKICCILTNMEITHLGKSAFRIKTKTGVVVMDPYGKSTGSAMSKVSADLVTISSRQGGSNDEEEKVSATSRRKAPFVIDEPGEYEVESISIFGYKSGEKNIVYVMQVEDLRIAHLGNLTEMPEKTLSDLLDNIDVVMVPIGGEGILELKSVVELVNKIESTYIIPMGDMSKKDKFVEAMGKGVKSVESLNLAKATLPADLSEIVLFG
jgi:L-ascorbate metabolism protein UlaG (beta-lactamase superfamily)